jgi:uncharacterized protein
MRGSYFASARKVKKQITGKTFKQKASFILSLRGDSHWLAFSFAIGIFIGVTPFYGAHTVLAITLVSVFRFNLPATIIGAWLTFPPILPFVYYFGYRLGRFILPGTERVPRAILFETINNIMRFNITRINESREVVAVIKQLFLGCTVMGLILSISGYFFLKYAIETHRKHVAKRICRELKKI